MEVNINISYLELILHRGINIARPLRTKKASDVAFLLKNIYENKEIPLTYPKVFQCDNGSEFKSDVTKLLERTQCRDKPRNHKI